MVEKKKTAWWRFVLAVIVFVLLHLFAAAIIAFIQQLLDFFAPVYLRTDTPALWGWFVGYALAPAMTAGAVYAITKEHKVFTAVLCFIGAAYSFFVSAWNYVAGVNSLGMTIAVVIGGVSYIAVGVHYILGKKEVG